MACFQFVNCYLWLCCLGNINTFWVAHDDNATEFSTAIWPDPLCSVDDISLVICAPDSQRNSGVQTAHRRSTCLSLGHLTLIILQSLVAFNLWCTLPMEKPLYSNLTSHGCLGKLALQVINHKMESYAQLPCLMSWTKVYSTLTYSVATWLPISMIHL